MVYTQSCLSEVPQEESLSVILKVAIKFTCELVGRYQQTGKNILINVVNEFITNGSTIQFLRKKSVWPSEDSLIMTRK